MCQAHWHDRVQTDNRPAAAATLAPHLQHRARGQQLRELCLKVVAVLEEPVLISTVEEVPVMVSSSLILGCQVSRNLRVLHQIHGGGAGQGRATACAWKHTKDGGNAASAVAAGRHFLPSLPGAACCCRPPLARTSIDIFAL